jgi:hypothetical protein
MVYGIALGRSDDMGITGKVYSIDEVLSMLQMASNMCSESLSLQWKAFKKKSSEQYGDPLCDGEYVSDAAIKISELEDNKKRIWSAYKQLLCLKRHLLIDKGLV